MLQRGSGIVTIIPLFISRLIRSGGGGTSFTTDYLDLPQLKEVLPFAASMKLHTVARQTTAACEWKVVFCWSADGNDWSSAVDLHSAISADGQSITTPYATLANFGRLARFGVSARASSGTGQEGAVASAWLEITWRS